MSSDSVVVKRPRGMAVLQVLSFPMPILGLFAPAAVFILPAVAAWGGYAAIGVVAYLVALYWRSRSVRLVLGEDGLVVVNLLGTPTISAREIVGLEWGRVGLVTAGGDRCIDVIRADGSHVHVEASVALRVRRSATGEVESRFDDSAIRKWASQRKIRVQSETAAFEERVRRSRQK